MNDFGRLALAFFGSLFALATVAVVVSGQAQTGAILTDAGTAVSTSIGAADAPITGGSSSSGLGLLK